MCVYMSHVSNNVMSLKSSLSIESVHFIKDTGYYNSNTYKFLILISTSHNHVLVYSSLVYIGML